ncbi:MAG: sulfite reductase (NADPH) hemoprotein beta-component [Flavobacteriales bacterium]|jgi:sulfite reductase (NADPH) hemoprotein beta-component
MYVYDDYDRKIINERVEQYKRQTTRFLEGKLKEEEFLPLRLQNGLYVQRLAPMLRIAVPYGMINTRQLRKLAKVARNYDKGYVHFTTRQNIQLNWPKLEEVPDILAELAGVEMHAVQTSGNCIRNTTTDQFAGVAVDEIVDPRPYCEIIRQWSTFHPEFAFLPRKFKIAVSGTEDDRAAIHFHDIGLQIVTNDRKEIGFQVLVGGGLGRTPVIASVVREFLPEKDLLTYLEAILRVYNLRGRRDNKYKARIKILVKATGVEEFSALVEDEWQHIRDTQTRLTDKEINRAKSYFTEHDYETINAEPVNAANEALASENKAFSNWMSRNISSHKVEGYCAVSLSLKPIGVPPGDVTDRQLDAIADLADQYSFSEVRSTHQQNIVLADIKISDLFDLWSALRENGLATPNIGTLNDMICCPGGDYCSLANAKSIPVAEAIQNEFDDLDYLYDLGDIELNISGCMNACGHHHIGHIGILGVDKRGKEFYQIQLGGRQDNKAAIGKVLGPSFSREEVTSVIVKIINVYTSNRVDGETFINAYDRLGIVPFKEAVYAASN